MTKHHSYMKALKPISQYNGLILRLNEQKWIAEALLRNYGDRPAAANELGINLSALDKRLERYCMTRKEMINQ